MKNLLTCISVLLLIAGFNSSLTAQPQYYNYNTNGSNNSFPFNIPAGKDVQLLYLPGDFNQPAPAPAGTIVSIAFRIADTYPLGPWTYTDLTIKLGQSTITSFTSGAFYTGPLTTVYYRASVSLTGTAGQWMTITLDNPFPYDPTQSLIVDVGQCTVTGATGYSMCFTAGTGNRRNWSVGGCPFTYYGPNTSIYHMGINMVTGTPPSVVTTAATAVSTNTATLNGTVNANGSSTTVTFEYGLTTTYGTTVPGVPGTVTGNTVTPVSANISGLTISTLYHYRAKGVNIAGTTNGNDMTFTTTNCPLPVAPGTITGPTSICGNSTGNVYSVAAIPGVTGYGWTVPPGATITAGANTNSITVTVGQTSGTVTVYGINVCGNGPTATLAVTVNPVPIPVINGQNSVCINSGYLFYQTQAGMNNYVWAISSGGAIVSGQGTNQVQVTWNGTGSQSISVIFISPTGCSPTVPTILPVTISTIPGNAGTITGTAAVCGGANGVAYSTPAITGALSYVWILPAGATIASGAGTNSITVNFAGNASSGNITVYGNNLCGNGSGSPPFAVTVTPLPADAGIITGPAAVCQGATEQVYLVPAILGATGYVWTLPAGAAIVAGANTNAITVDFGITAVSGVISVYGTNSCGNGNPSPDFNLTVNPIPPAPVVTNTGYTVYSSAPAGNQWYYSATQGGTGVPIPGATSQTYDATQTGTGYYWSVVTLNGCSSDTSNHKFIISLGVDSHPASRINIYPVPNEGMFNVSFSGSSNETYTIIVFNNLGVKIFEEAKVEVNGSLQKVIDLRPVPDGVYTVIFENSQKQVVKKIIVNK